MGPGGHLSIMQRISICTWFSHSVGAMDGNNVPVIFPLQMQGNYWNKKGVTTLNNLVCVYFQRDITF